MSHYKKLSILIPALNEERNISNTIQSVIDYFPDHIAYEIIVGDHGSTDNTRAIAEELGATVLEKKGGTIASLRNDLAKYASGDLLVFNDADVLLTSDWEALIRSVVGDIERSDGKCIVGGLLLPPQKKNWLIDNWFRVQKMENKKYAGTGHLIVSKELLTSLGGFGEHLASGEDYDFSVRAKKNGINVYIDNRLRVIHNDYPETLKSFYYRELWHGTGDFSDVGSFIKSKVALASVIFMISIIGFSVNYFSIHKYIVLNVVGILLMPIAFSFLKFKDLNLKQRSVNIILWAVYLTARSISFFYRHNKRRLNVAKTQ